MIRAILFDVMGTLVHEPFYGDIPKFFGCSLEDLRVQRHPTAWIDFEKGEIDEDEYARRFFLDGRVLDKDGLKRALTTSYIWLEGMEALCQDLVARGLPLHALSNYSPWYAMIEEKLGLSRYLKWSFVSCDTGHRKPDSEAYLGAARALGLAPEECLFIDDRPVNVDAAKKLGMPAVLFEDVASLRATLATLI